MKRSLQLSGAVAGHRRFVLIPCLLLTMPLLAHDLGVQAQEATFNVIVAEKTPRHPYHNQGELVGYVINGVHGAELTLTRGNTYVFEMDNVPPDHPFYISTSEMGFGEGEYTDGVDGNFATGNETLTFTVPLEAPDVLFYQCQVHQFMGAKLNIIGGVVEVGLEPVASGLVAPLGVVEPPDGTGRLFIIDQPGVIHIVPNDGPILDEPFLDLRDRMVELRSSFDERGLLGLAFHPDFSDNDRFYVYYSAPLRDDGPGDWDHTSHISEFTVSEGNANLADHDSERIILQVDQPQFNHNGGTVVFGPDGYLYVSLGDGGGADDTGLGHVDDWYEVNEGGNAQAYRENLLGSILRIDVDTGDPYAIPPDNPFVGTEGLDETYAFGLRNPYRISFDMGGTNQLFAGDAGQLRWEGVYIIENGGNYGWNVKEGRHCFNTDDSSVDRQTCPDEDPEGRPLLDPVIEYANNRQPGGLGAVIIGGHVYRGENLPDFQGRYIFGEWSASSTEPEGIIFIETNRREVGTWDFERVEIIDRADGELGHFLLGFGQDLSGEIYVMATDRRGPEDETGRVYRMVHPTDVSAEPIAEVPASFVLHQNYPNPFNPSTTIRFDLVEPAAITLRIYDLLGRQVASIVDEHLQAGTHAYTWEGIDDRGQPVVSGVYVYQLTSGELTESRFMTFVK